MKTDERNERLKRGWRRKEEEGYEEAGGF